MPPEWRTSKATESVASQPAGSGGAKRPTVSFRPAFAAGARAIAPVLPAAAVVGLVTGVAADSVGLPPIQAAVTSAVVYSPTVLLTAFALLETGTSAVVIVVASLVVAIRFVLLSASIAPYFARLPTRWRWVLAYFLWTPVYALSVERFDADRPTSRRGYYLGAALPLWVTVQAAVILGASSSSSVPARWQLRFVVPLAFIALLVRFLTDGPSQLAAAVAGALAVVSGGLPMNLGIVIAVLGGTTVGVIISRQEARQ